LYAWMNSAVNSVGDLINGSRDDLMRCRHTVLSCQGVIE
jgi:hypothetical protein